MTFFQVEATGQKAFMPSLQGLRGLSALSVLLVHLYLIAQHQSIMPPGIPTAVTALWSVLGNGVALFFIISGYLIPASLARHGEVSGFLIDRVLRIMPLYVVLHCVVFSIGPWVGYKWMAGLSPLHYFELFTANILLVAPLVDLPLAQQNSWSLTYEWLFYIFVSLLWLFDGQGRRKRGSGLLLLIGALCLFFWPMTLFFLVGAFLAYTGWTLRLGRLSGVLLSTLALIALYALNQAVSSWLAWIPGLIFAGIALDDRSLWARALATRLMQWFGRISYSLYLIHPFAIYGAWRMTDRLAGNGRSHTGAFLLYCAIGLAGSVIASTLSYELIEVRLRRVLARLLGRKPATSRTTERLATPLASLSR